MKIEDIEIGKKYWCLDFCEGAKKRECVGKSDATAIMKSGDAQNTSPEDVLCEVLPRKKWLGLF